MVPLDGTNLPALPRRREGMTFSLGGVAAGARRRSRGSAEERMLRVAAWTGGLFGAGAMVCHVYPTSWIEPVVLLALGATLLLVSARSGKPSMAARRAMGTAKEAPAA
jgi:hypothetical protein